MLPLVALEEAMNLPALAEQSKVREVTEWPRLHGDANTEGLPSHHTVPSEPVHR